MQSKQASQSSPIKLEQNSQPKSKDLTVAKHFIFLAIVSWIAHFYYFQGFGLNGEDLYRVGRAIAETNWSAILNVAQTTLLKPGGVIFGVPIEGRILHPMLIYFFSFLGGKIAGLPGVYGIAYLINLTNTFLIYALLKRIYQKPSFAVLGALGFCLFPADTTRAWLTSSFGIQPALTLLLVALHCYLLERKFLSYAVIFSSLFCYETVLPVFIAAPLINQAWNLRLRWELIKHTLVLVCLTIFVLVLRRITGEGRVIEVASASNFLTPIRQAVIGPIVSSGLFFYRALTSLHPLSLISGIFLILSFLG
jgi:hypothetical protein